MKQNFSLKNDETVYNSMYILNWLKTLMLVMIEKCQNTVHPPADIWGCKAADWSECPWWLLSTAEIAYNGHMSIRPGPWSNGRRLLCLKSCFLLDQVDGYACALFTWARDGQGCIMWRKHVGGCSSLLWAVLCCQTLGPGIHVEVILTCTTYLPKVADLHGSSVR